MNNQVEKARLLHTLHKEKEILIFPNVWDMLSAKIMNELGYKALATASAAIAFSNGYIDGEKMPLDDVIKLLRRIVMATSLPVTADIESGYASNIEELERTIPLFLQTGIAGINIEDTNHSKGNLFSIEEQVERIRGVRRLADEMSVPLFINARTDVMLYNDWVDDCKLDEIIRRGLAYQKAGADCFFPIVLKKEKDIEKVVRTLKIPINILALPGVPNLSVMERIGVKRVSVGPGVFKYAVQAIKKIASELKSNNGLEDIYSNTITSDYIKDLLK